MTRRPTELFISDRMKVALVVVHLVSARAASAQAFLPPAGEGNVTVTYQDTFARGHLSNTGVLFTDDKIRAQSLMWDVEYGLSDRVALNVSLPFAMARYVGTDPHLVGINRQPSTLDNGTYHGTFQDFHAGVRYNVWTRPLAITPFVEATIPSHHYESLGHSAIGQDLRTLVMGATIGGFVDAVPGIYFQTQLSQAVVQKVLGIRPNRRRVDSEIGYFVTPRFAARFLESLQTTQDGLDFLVRGGTVTGVVIHSRNEPIPSVDFFLNHDRLSRNNFLSLGAGVLFAVNDSVEVFAAGSKLVWGENLHPHRGLSVGANWHFRAGHGAPHSGP
jgi:hypothetical protein